MVYVLKSAHYWLNEDQENNVQLLMEHPVYAMLSISMDTRPKFNAFS